MAQAESEAHPVALFILDETDQEYHRKDSKGRSPRCIVEQVDRDRYFFPSREDAESFMSIHGMIAVSNQEMEKLRRELAA